VLSDTEGVRIDGMNDTMKNRRGKGYSIEESDDFCELIFFCFVCVLAFLFFWELLFF